MEATQATEIVVTYLSVDRFRQQRKFKTLAGAQKFAAKWVGETPDIGSFYAVSFDGIGRITVSGTSIHSLFPKLAPAAKADDVRYYEE